MREHLIDLLTEESAQETDAPKLAGVVVGKLCKVADHGLLLVDFPQNPSTRPLTARSTIALSANDSGREIVLMFEEGDFHKPIIIGMLQPPEVTKENGKTNGRLREEKPLDVKVDDERLTFTAQKEIVLRCGQASITLTRAGKILLRGTYVLSRSSGANRIKGCSVQIN